MLAPVNDSMRERPWLLPIASVALFAAGVATGWWMRGEEVRSMGGESDAAGVAGASAVPATDGGVGAHARASAITGDGGRGRASAGAQGDAPRGEGSVAVVGASGVLARAPASSAPASTTVVGTPPPPLDGGRPPTGRLDASAIRDVVRESRDQLGFCFAWQLHQHPELGGRLTMDFTIGEDGAVTRAEVVDDEIGDETVQRCFLSVTQRMRFPVPEGGGEVRVRYPFTLSAVPDREEGDPAAPPSPHRVSAPRPARE
jgi:hypothetical protein